MVVEQTRPAYRRRWNDGVGLDVTVGVILGSLAGLWALLSSVQIAPLITDYRYLDLWFQGDSPRAFANMTNMLANPWSRDNLHPLFRVVTYPLTTAIAGLLALSPQDAVRLVIAGVASLWAAGFYAVLRLMCLARFDALLFSLVLVSTAAFVFWGGLPETFPFGSLTLIFSMGLVAASECRRMPSGLSVVNNLMTVGFVPTSALAGLAATLFLHPLKKAMGILALSTAALFGLWSVHKAFFPVDRASTQDILLDQAGGPIPILTSIVAHTLVMPEIKLLRNWNHPSETLWRMTTQFSLPGSGGILAAIALAAALGLVAIGLWSAFTTRRLVKLRWMLAVVGLGFLGAHILFGDETFLYSLQFAPLLVLLAAFGTIGPMRPVALALAAAFVLSASVHNVAQFQHASAFVQGHLDSKHPIQVWPGGATYVDLVYESNRAHPPAVMPPWAPKMPQERFYPINYRFRTAIGEFKRQVQAWRGGQP